MAESNGDLDRVASEASTCTRCRLHESRTQVVFGQGSPTADLMFVGEAPGFHEDRKGYPFVGPSGQLLNRLLGEIGLRREDVYICNVVKCLAYDAQVQLADGSWRPIGHLVRSRYRGAVTSVDDDGFLVARRVTGWHQSPLAGRRVFSLGYAAAGPSSAIQLTGDHEVLTDHGFVPVQELPSGALIATGRAVRHLRRPKPVAAGGSGVAAAAVGLRARGRGQVEGVAGPPAPLPSPVRYDLAEVEEITDRYTGGEAVFCIDVEETHNFVTSGGVVHNCRPPANRDPRPDEIETCRRWLDAQLRLIDPKVIVTLGNFASKTLLGTTTGITRLRGRTYEFEHRVLLPTFHPSAALRADTSGRTENRTLNGMREDFQSLARVLAERKQAGAGPSDAPSPSGAADQSGSSGAAGGQSRPSGPSPAAPGPSGPSAAAGPSFAVGSGTAAGASGGPGAAGLSGPADLPGQTRVELAEGEQLGLF
jgi:uracil-DNA glycosylase family 4